MDFFRKPIFIIILAADLIAAGIWAYISNRASQTASSTTATSTSTTSTPDTTISNLTNADASTLNDSIDTQLALADTKAAEVDKKLQLAAIEVDLTSAIDQNSGSTYYIYTSSSDKVNNWVIAISNSDNKFVRSRTVKDDYMGNVTAINRSFLKISYVTALQTAEKNGGKDFREGNTITGIKITLKNADPKGWLYWFIDYATSTNQKEIQIDASTGAIVPAS